MKYHLCWFLLLTFTVTFKHTLNRYSVIVAVLCMNPTFQFIRGSINERIWDALQEDTKKVRKEVNSTINDRPFPHKVQTLSETPA